MQTIAPRGQVTLVFTDIQGSTSLWEHIPQTMRASLDVHDRIMREAIERHRGYEVKTEGDAFMVAFASPLEALQWCLDVQLLLQEQSWPEILLRRPEACLDRDEAFCGLRVRMGIHCGEPECRPCPTSGRMDYFGPMVNRAARVSGAGHGGQILLSKEAVELIDSPPKSTKFHPLGSYEFKGLKSPVELFQATHVELAGRKFPPVKGTGPRCTNIAKLKTSFFGRTNEIEQLNELVQKNHTVLTLLGPGGMGKTTLARHWALSILEQNLGLAEVWFVDLSACYDLDGLITAFADTLSIALDKEARQGDHRQQIGIELARRNNSLVILDNAEQIIDLVAESVELFQEAAPDSRFLVTSRCPLNVKGERLVELKPLDIETAITLFNDRARNTSTEDELRPLVELLDRVPLAIELAASRASVLSLSALVNKLSNSIGLLRSRNKALTPRQATMRGAIEWSWNLLDDWAQRGLAQCSIFLGGFSFDAADAVVELDEENDMLDLLDELHHHSFLRRLDGVNEESRYGLYETIRHFAKEKLQGYEGMEELPHRHASYYIERAESIKHDDLLRFSAIEFENLRAAHRASLQREWSVAAQIVLVLAPLLGSRGPVSVFITLLNETIEAYRNEVDAVALYTKLLSSRGLYLAWGGSSEIGLRDLKEAKRLAAANGNLKLEANVLISLGKVLDYLGSRAEGDRCLQNAIELAKAAGNTSLLAQALECRAVCASFSGDYELQLSCLDEARPLISETLSPIEEASLERNRADALINLSRLEEGTRALQNALSVADEAEDAELASHCRRGLALIAMSSERWEEACTLLDRAVAQARQIRNFGHLAILLRLQGLVALFENKKEEAAEHCSEALQIAKQYGVNLLLPLQHAYLSAAMRRLSKETDAKASAKEAAKLLNTEASEVEQRMVELLLGESPEQSKRKLHSIELTLIEKLMSE